MRIAAIYDIHGNLPALTAALSEIRGAGVDLLVVGGDIVPGPMPSETLSMLRGLDMRTEFIRGNGDRAISEASAGIPTEAVPARFRPVISWCVEQLTEEQCAFLGDLPATFRIEAEGMGDVLFCHATPRNDTEIFTRETEETKLLPVFVGAHAAMVVCGHTHMQFDRRVAALRVVNAGSIGMPSGKPGAHWLMLASDVELRITPYDLVGAAEMVRKTAYPDRENYAARILNPVADEEILRQFAGAELK